MKIYLFIIGLLFPIVLFAQKIEGKVTDTKNEALIGASVYWLDNSQGTMTEINGNFSIEFNENSNRKLVASYVGYKSDTIEITNQKSVKFKLVAIKSLNEVVITDERDGIILSNLDPIKTENITQTELKKAACCDLAGCFETQLTVQPQTSNVITNAKELRILGLSGVYNQVLVDGFPMIQALSYTYGISGIPGTLVENIFVSKGANSVLQGYESISGQINVITKDAGNTDKLLLNLYVNSFMEKQLNANYAFKKGKWRNITALQTVQPAKKIDNDKDNFLDLPLLTRYIIYNKLNYGKESDWGWSSKIGLKYLTEERIGGQYTYNAKTDQGNTSIYGQSVNFIQPEIYAKTGYRINDKHNIVLFANGYTHQQNSFFGTTKYTAKQHNIYANLQYELTYNRIHTLKTGLSFRHLNIHEKIEFTDTTLYRSYNGDYKRKENIPGIFAENSMSFLNNKITWISGLRLDNHNQFGSTLTPRMLLKYDLSSKTVFRANIGTGWRTVNLFSENIGLLVSSRDIIFAEKILPERAINYGINMVHKYEINKQSGYLSADFYRTDFQNQIFPDYDSDTKSAIIKNFKGPSISNGFQLELNLKIAKRFDIKTGYNYLDVYRIESNKKIQLPFNPKHRILGAISFKPLTKKFNIDINVHWFDKQRLPDTKTNPVEFQRPDYSKPFTLYNAQFTYNFKRIELYVGCENIFNFRQAQPIVSWQNPFGPYFDTSSVWGPTRGRELYCGIRYKLDKN
jgi:outer membrane receptor for ferrienterochelin and colicins